MKKFLLLTALTFFGVSGQSIATEQKECGEYLIAEKGEEYRNCITKTLDAASKAVEAGKPKLK